jgi:uncharacterized SAM-binding protein YcdF (DUF218 family)
VHPYVACVILVGAALLLFFCRRLLVGGLCLFIGLLLATAASVAPFPDLVLAGLENRFPQPSASPDKALAGVILLDGGPASVAEAARLARASELARIVYSTGGGPGEGDGVVASLGHHGISADRVLIKTFSRNTADDASSAYKLVQPQPQVPWVLVTAAFHTPRAVAAFRKAGFSIVARPVLRFANPQRPLSFDLLTGPDKLRRTLRECVGLLAYYLLGYSTELFPGPEAGQEVPITARR